MRILLITPILDPNFLWAGSHRVVYEIAKSLIKRGHKVVVLTSDMLNIRTKIKQSVYATDLHSHVKILRARILSCKLTEMTSMTISIDTLDFLKRQLQNFDVVHAHEYTTFENIILRYYATKYNVPYVLQAHGSLPRIGKAAIKWFYDQVFGYRILRDASKVIALSEFEARQYEKMGVPMGKIVIIPNGINFEEYRDLPSKGSFKNKFNIDDDEKIVLYLGRIHSIKGIDILVKAFANIIKKSDNLRLVIAGPDDGYLCELQALIRALEIRDKVLITGPMYGRGKLEAYVDADVYVLPSKYEMFPMGLLEAYACSKPVVDSMVGGLKDLVVDGVTGLLVESGNVKQLARSISSFLNDDCKAKEAGLKGNKFVKKNFTAEKVADRIESLYEDVGRLNLVKTP